MASLVDDVLHNILARLPGKHLLRLRCVSKHWNRLISDPCFMKARSRRMILLPFLRPLVVLDHNVPALDLFKIRCHIEKPEAGTGVSSVGAFNGIVLLALTHYKSSRCHLMLYNPLTCASRKLMVMDIPPSWLYRTPFVYGIDEDDFKIVRFEVSNRSMYTWDVFDLKTNSWSGRKRYLKGDFHFAGDAGMFLNGFLYWATSSSIDGSSGVMALNVKDMVVSRIKLPVPLKYVEPLLGSIDGCLCMVGTNDSTRFDLWVGKKQGVEISWTKACSFTINLKGYNSNKFRPVCILGNGKILFTSNTMLLVIYDTSKDSYLIMGDLLGPYDFEPMASVSLFNGDTRSIEYVESLVSPFDICFN